MSPLPGRLSQLPEMQRCPKLDRSLLKDQAADTLRTYISSGRITEGDPARCTRSDLAIHRAAGNPYLLGILESLLGVIYVLAERVKTYGAGESAALLQQHRSLVERIEEGDGPGAAEAVEAQLRRALQASLRTFRVGDVEGGPS